MAFVKGSVASAGLLRGPTLSLALRFSGARLEDLLIELPDQPGQPPRPGEIHAARVDRIIDGRGGGRRAAFLRAAEDAALFLPDAEEVSPGQRLLVEITRGPEGRKAARASRRLTFAGRLLAHTPGAPGVNVSRKISDPDLRAALVSVVTPFAARGGFVIRTRVAEAAPEVLAQEAERLAAEAGRLLDEPLDPPRRLRPAPGLEARIAADWGLEPVDLAEEPALARAALDALATLQSSRVALDGAPGAWMALERLEALVAIDINTGEGGADLAVNLAAMREIPRQLRLRGWGGMVVIDLAPLRRNDRDRISEALRSAADPALDVAGFGPLGLLEAVRQRDRPETAPHLDEAMALLEAAARDMPAR